MKFNPIKKIILFGGSWILAELVIKLKKSGKEIVVFSSKRHLEEIANGKNETLSEVLKKSNIRFYDSENINKDKNLKREINRNTLGIAFGASWIFEKETVNLFETHHLLDFMGIDLPRYRGGAHYTWQILHQNKKGCTNLQIIKGGVETFHKGEIIKRREYSLPKTLKKPVNFFNYIIKQEIDFLEEFLIEVNQMKKFSLKKLDEKESSYYPFLYTKENGLIDWSWNGEEIYLFINAFDEPYAGASTYLDGKKVFLKDCYMIDPQEKYHPFTSGIIIRKNEKGIFVAAIGKLLLIKTILDEKGVIIIDSINPGDRLYTPSHKLDEARSFKAYYDAKGLGRKK